MRRCAQRLRLVATCLLTLSIACGGGSVEKPPSASSDDVDEARGPVELTVRTPDGRLIFVGDLRGKPVLLFLFATFDGISQAALRPLKRFVRDHPDVHVVGIAVQPNPQSLLDAWAYAVEPTFPVGYEPRERLVRGTSALGEVEAVPTFVMLDARGYPTKRHTGYASEHRLEWMLWETRGGKEGGAGPPPKGPPPLIGEPPADAGARRPAPR